MPRARRVFVEGGTYHVYNRVTRGEPVFASDAEAGRLMRIMREASERDGLVVLAWAILPNHYHLAVRSTGPPLWRTMASVQTRFTKSFNGRKRIMGPFWQSRYKAKLVEDGRYLSQLVLYIHLNAVVAGLTDDAARYRWSGHGEVLGHHRKKPLVDTDELLLVFGPERRTATRAYRAAMEALQGEDWAARAPGHLPWWRLGRPPKEDEDLVVRGTPFVDELGRSTALERPRLDADELTQRVCELRSVPLEQLGSRAKDAETVRTREIVTVLGVERYELRVIDIATALGARYDTVSLWGRRGAKRRAADPGFRSEVDKTDEYLVRSGEGSDKAPRSEQTSTRPGNGNP